jgi:4-alpha-glucanotransferase
LPPRLKTWGWALQLYSLRSARSWGMGDLEDLRRVARWSATELGAGVLLLNPLGAATPGTPQNPSPYFPSSRLFRNMLYIRIDEVPGASEMKAELERFGPVQERLNRERVIDRDAIYRLKMDALERLYKKFREDGSFDDYCTLAGEPLTHFAVFCALAERFGMGWPKWPRQYRHPDSSSVARFARENANRVRFHRWIQWVLDRQLGDASKEIKLMQDLPIGFDPRGADAWIWQEMLASGATVGAPPDEFNTLGQDWGLPPFIPHKLKAGGYQPIRQTLRAMFRHGGGLRIDHIMGLFRLYWIPKGVGPAGGGYVRYPARDLIDILALESHRAKAFVVGEDLGTVEKEIRDELRKRRILSYRLLWFEKKKPSAYPRLAMAAVTTHDLPTIAGLWSGYDLEKQKQLKLNPNEEATREIKNRLAKWTRLSPSAPTDEVIVRTHLLLSHAPSALLTATLEDALGVQERPNMPNATSQWPNWSIPVPASLEEIEKDPLIRKVAGALGKGRRSRGKKTGGSDHP